MIMAKIGNIGTYKPINYGEAKNMFLTEFNQEQQKRANLDKKVFADNKFKVIGKKTFTKQDENDLHEVVCKISAPSYANSTHVNNQINNFSKKSYDDLARLFNLMSTSSKYTDLQMKLPRDSSGNIKMTPRQSTALPYLFSIVKHYQEPDKYPLMYVFWMNLCNVFFPTKSGINDYDQLCYVYNKMVSIPLTDTPKHSYFSAYMDALARKLAKDIRPNIGNYTKNAIKGVFNISDYDVLLGFNSNTTVKASSNPTQTSTLSPVPEPKNAPDRKDDETRHPLNLILYGPPGTGKTYNTVNEALDIIQPKWREDFISQQNSPEGIKDERDYALYLFNKYKEEGRIVFTTFHQSLSYEEFIEGIKPIPPQNQEQSLNIEMQHFGKSGSTRPFGDGKTIVEGLNLMTYEVKPGIFKQLCADARPHFSTKILNQNISTIDFTKTRIFKMSLGQKGAPKTEGLFNYCIENNCLALGWGDDIDFSECTEKKDFKKLYPSWGSQAVEIFKIWMRNDDVVLISDGSKYIKAIARIKGEYKYDEDGYENIHQFRDVEWLYVGDNLPIKNFYDKTFSQQTIYGFYNGSKEGKNDYNGNFNTEKLNEYIVGSNSETETKPYVLIIDEINRGNVSQIFGELITLIEEDKRTTKWDKDQKQYIDNPEKITVKLPYSPDEDPFGVPGNLYIIGTMNTADRSVEALDTALRRRFDFKEMMPKPELVTDSICDYALKDILNTINERIRVLKDREHQIGHSYFMKCKTEEDLKNVFKNNIVPLLQEYFYGNYAYIGLVLGNGFVKKEDANPKFASLDGYTYDSDNEPTYRLLTDDEWEELKMNNALDNLKVNKSDTSENVTENEQLPQE